MPLPTLSLWPGRQPCRPRLVDGINDEQSDDDDMTRERNKIYAQGNALIRKLYMCTENVKTAV